MNHLIFTYEGEPFLSIEEAVDRVPEIVLTEMEEEGYEPVRKEKQRFIAAAKASDPLGKLSTEELLSRAVFLAAFAAVEARKKYEEACHILLKVEEETDKLLEE